MTDFGTPLLVANPAAGNGRDGVLDRLVAGLRQRGAPVDVAITTARGHATELARAAVDEGRRFLVAVGGDGTVHEIVNGMVDADTGVARAPDLVLGVVSAGSGSDFARTFGLDRSPERLVDHLVSPTSMVIDLGRVRYLAADGRPRRSVFANVAEVGFGARVARTSARLPRRMGSSRYAVGIVASWAGFRRVEATVTVDGGSSRAALCNIVAANGQFYGGGFHVAPRAVPSDGRLDIQTWGGTVTDVVRASRLLRRGDHLQRDDVRVWSSRVAEVEAQRPMPVEADGEFLGHTPVVFDVLHHVLRVKI